MIIVRGSQNLPPVLAGLNPATRSVVTIGNFDGIHQGHRRIMDLVIQKAKAVQGIAAVYTFRPHPQEALRPNYPIQLLSTYDEKLEILASLGVELTVEETFGPDVFSLSPEEFFTDILLGRFKAKAIVVGHDFAFGKDRKGDLAALASLCSEAGVELDIVPAFKIGNHTVSSSSIRKSLLAGDIALATQLLGRPFTYRGVVMRGDARGRTIGFPTANLKLENKLALPHGVYATQACLKRGEGKYQVLPSVTNVGVRPTFKPAESELPVVVETHVLDQVFEDFNIYGETLEVRFIQKLRSELKFSGIESLKIQIQKDAEQARQLLPQSAV
ncbi:MAG: bifunctional riboflavin kinase/FAD synthetase [Methylotenera sp.]|nr:bifunctional riboflavin kinase/FAD synthetase [Oligoflexia bacterium]